MYLYETDRRRNWRPDLLPAILSWLASVPESDWQYCLGFRVGETGEFMADFAKSPDRGGPPKRVQISFDHDFYEVTSDVAHVVKDKPEPYNSETVHRAFNLA